MHVLLLVAHIGAAILFVGAATLATSLFPRAVRDGEVAVARLLNRVSRVYGVCSLAVPVLGLALAGRVGYLSQGWVHWSLGLFAVGLALLFGLILPGQRRLLAAVERGEAILASSLGSVRAASGFYAVIWLVVLGLMVAKPG